MLAWVWGERTLQRLRQHSAYQQQYDRLDAHRMEIQQGPWDQSHRHRRRGRRCQYGFRHPCRVARARTHWQGQRIVVSMQEALLGFMISEFHEHFIGIEVGNYPIPVADGYFTFRMPDFNDEAWAKLASLMGRDDLVADGRFATMPARKQNRSELLEIIKTWARGKTRQELWDGLRSIDYFGAPVLSMGEVIEDPHIKERNAFIERNHPTAGLT